MKIGLSWVGTDDSSSLNFAKVDFSEEETTIQKATFDETSNNTPAASENHIVWSFDNHINVAELDYDRMKLHNKIVFNEAHDRAPAYSYPVVAWKGDAAVGMLRFAYDINRDKKFNKKVVLDETSIYAPAVVYVNQLINIVWTGTDGRINVLQYDPVRERVLIKFTLNQKIYGSPSVAFDLAKSGFDIMYIAWIYDSKLHFGEVSIIERDFVGKIWVNTWTELKPSIIAYNGLYMCWVDPEKNLNLGFIENGSIKYQEKFDEKTNVPATINFLDNM